MHRRRHDHGFTLLELVLVLVIIATCAALAAPSLRGFTRARRLPNTGQELLNALRYCRNSAISDGTTYRVYLDTQGNKWLVTKDDGTGTNTFAPISSPVLPAEYDLPEGIYMDTTMLPRPPDNLRYISFDAGGRADVAMVTLKSDSAEVDVICDSPLSIYRMVVVNGGG